MGYMLLMVAAAECLFGFYCLIMGRFPTRTDRFAHGIGSRVAGLAMMAPLVIILLLIFTRPYGPIEIGGLTNFFDFLLQRLFIAIGLIVGFPIVAFFIAVLTDYAPRSDWVPNSRRRFEEEDEEVEETRPRRRKRHRDDDDAEEAPRSARKRAKASLEEDDDDDEPRRRRGRRDRERETSGSVGKWIGILILCLVLGGGALAVILYVVQANGPVEVVAEEGNFKIALPSKPKVETKEIPGMGQAHMWSVNSSRGTSFVLYSDMPIPLNESDGVLQERLMNARNGLLHASGGVLESEHPRPLHGWPGLDIRVNLPALKGTARSHVFLVGRRMYQVTAMGENDFAKSSAVDDMMNSFTLLNPPVRQPVVAVGPDPKIDPGKKDPIKEFPKKDPPKKDPPKLLPGVLAHPPEPFEDLRVAKFQLPSNSLVPCLTWSRDGSSFYAVDSDHGTVRRIALNGFKEEAVQKPQRKIQWLSLSNHGLLATCEDPAGVLLLDEATLEQKKQATLKDKTVVVSAPAMDTALAIDSAGIGGILHVITVLDLPNLRAVNQFPAKSFTGTAKDLTFGDAALTPDGKYLIVCNTFRMFRFSFKGKLMVGEEIGAWIGGQGAAGKLTLSTDGAVAWMTNMAGNHETKYGTLPFNIGALQRPVAKIESGPFCRAFAWDHQTRQFYAQNEERSLIIYDANGNKMRDYDLKAGQMRQFLVHPDGRKLLVLGEHLFYVEMPGG